MKFDIDAFQVSLTEGSNLPILWRPILQDLGFIKPYIAYTPYFKFCPTPTPTPTPHPALFVVLFLWLNGLSHHIWRVTFFT